MKLRHLAVAAAIFVGFGSAHAQMINLTNGAGSFNGSVLANAATFLDTYSLVLSTGISSGSSAVINLEFQSSIDFSSLQLFDSTGSSMIVAGMNTNSSPFVEVWTLAIPALAAGTYQLKVGGSNLGAAATYTGAVAVTPVPEPETYALALAALGLFAAGSRLKRKA